MCLAPSTAVRGHGWLYGESITPVKSPSPWKSLRHASYDQEQLQEGKAPCSHHCARRQLQRALQGAGNLALRHPWVMMPSDASAAPWSWCCRVHLSYRHQPHACCMRLALPQILGFLGYAVPSTSSCPKGAASDPHAAAWAGRTDRRSSSSHTDGMPAISFGESTDRRLFIFFPSTFRLTTGPQHQLLAAQHQPFSKQQVQVVQPRAPLQ